MMGKRHGVFSVIKFCGRIINSAKEHECGVSFYKIFSSPQSVNHLCYMQPPFLEDRSSVDESDTYGDSSVIARKSEQNNTDASEQERKKKRMHSCSVILRR